MTAAQYQKRPELLLAEHKRLANTLNERKEMFDRRITKIENQATRHDLWREFLDQNARDLARHIQVEQMIEALFV